MTDAFSIAPDFPEWGTASLRVQIDDSPQDDKLGSLEANFVHVPTCNCPQCIRALFLPALVRDPLSPVSLVNSVNIVSSTG
jgi:hypothetical protein